MIFDCFLYNGEDKMLEFRIQELSDIVDKFIIIESDYTFSGKPKKISYYDIENKLKKFYDKIIFIEYSDTPIKDAWKNEEELRFTLVEYFLKNKPHINDIILLSDIDEIPDTEILSKLDSSFKVGVFYHNFYYYNFDCRVREKWPGSIAVNAKIFEEQFKLSFPALRAKRTTLPSLNDKNNYKSGGWHLSYFGNIDYIINKIEGFSHQEYNKEEFKDPEKLKQLIETGKDLFGRKNFIIDIIKEDYLPKHIKLLK